MIGDLDLESFESSLETDSIVVVHELLVGFSSPVAAAFCEAFVNGESSRRLVVGPRCLCCCCSLVDRIILRLDVSLLLVVAPPVVVVCLFFMRSMKLRMSLEHSLSSNSTDEDFLLDSDVVFVWLFLFMSDEFVLPFHVEISFFHEFNKAISIENGYLPDLLLASSPALIFDLEPLLVDSVRGRFVAGDLVRLPPPVAA